MKCQNCGATSHVRDRYDGLCFTCAWPTDVTTAEPKQATAMEADLSRVTVEAAIARLHDHLKQDMYRRAMLPAHLLGSGRVRLPTGPLSNLTDVQPAPPDRHVEALQYALKGVAAARSADDGVLRVCGERRADGSAFCAGQVGHDGPHEWVQEVRYTTQGWHRAPAVTPEPKPPTLREWLGDRVSELGPWADVLREQPVPAAEVREWKWNKYGESWVLEFQTDTMRGGLSRTAVIDAARGDADPWDPSLDALQPGLFTRHPAVKPEPKLRTWFGNEEET